MQFKKIFRIHSGEKDNRMSPREDDGAKGSGGRPRAVAKAGSVEDFVGLLEEQARRKKLEEQEALTSSQEEGSGEKDNRSPRHTRTRSDSAPTVDMDSDSEGSGATFKRTGLGWDADSSDSENEGGRGERKDHNVENEGSVKKHVDSPISLRRGGNRIERRNSAVTKQQVGSDTILLQDDHVAGETARNRNSKSKSGKSKDSEGVFNFIRFSRRPSDASNSAGVPSSARGGKGSNTKGKDTDYPFSEELAVPHSSRDHNSNNNNDATMIRKMKRFSTGAALGVINQRSRGFDADLSTGQRSSNHIIKPGTPKRSSSNVTKNDPQPSVDDDSLVITTESGEVLTRSRSDLIARKGRGVSASSMDPSEVKSSLDFFAAERKMIAVIIYLVIYLIYDSYTNCYLIM